MYPETGTPEETAGSILLRPESYRTLAAGAARDHEGGLEHIARTTTLGREDLRGRIAELEGLGVLSVRRGVWRMPPGSSRVSLTDFGRAVADVLHDPERRPEIEEHLRYVLGNVNGALPIANVLRFGASGERFLLKITGYGAHRLSVELDELRERGLTFDRHTHHRLFGDKRYTALTGDGLVCIELALRTYEAAARGGHEALDILRA